MAGLFYIFILMKCLIFAAGLGTRLRPLTDTMPKALVPIAGRPLLAHTIDRLKAEGATEIVVNTHHFAEQVEAYLTTHDFDIPVHISNEREQLLDTGGGLRQALQLFTDQETPVLIHNVDIFSNAPLRQFYEKNVDTDATLMVSHRNSNRQLYFDNEQNLVGWKNLDTQEVRPQSAVIDDTLTGYAFSGIHLVSPRLLSELNTFPKKFSIMDFYLSVCQRLAIKGYPCNNLQLLDVGKSDSIAKAEAFLLSLQ